MNITVIFVRNFLRLVLYLFCINLIFYYFDRKAIFLSDILGIYVEIYACVCERECVCVCVCMCVCVCIIPNLHLIV